MGKSKNASDTEQVMTAQPDFNPVKFALEKFFQEHKKNLQRKHAPVDGKCH